MRSGAASTDLILPLLLGFLGPLCQEAGVVGGLLLTLLGAPLLESYTATLVLQHGRRDEALDLGRFGALLLALLLGQWAAHDVLPHIILLGQVVQLADLASPLGPETAWKCRVSQAWYFLLALLLDHQADDTEVGVNNAAAHRLALALASTPWSVARVALGQEQSHTSSSQHTLLHGKSLLVVASRDAYYVTLPFIAESVGLNFLAHTLLVENAYFFLIVNFNELLAASGWIGDVELNGRGGKKEISIQSSNIGTVQ